MKIRTRMAPSPTGYYHLGHIRTVLYDYALAKKSGGDFIIRIEDTDRTRFIEDATEKILADILDYGLNYDEGPEIGGPYAPYFQSERLEIYKEHANQLINDGHAYRCFCTSERLKELRADQQAKKIPTKYDKKCQYLDEAEISQRLADGEQHVIRLNVPENQDITWKDEVYGEITVNSNDVDDQILMKSDGFPTYHLAVVVDDHLMDITHVIRGNDWIPSTPKHVLLYKAFGWELPAYIHLPNLKEKDGTKKLSKRFGSVYAREFLNEGYLPEALLNFLMFLGWNPGTDREIYSLEEFVADFSAEKIHKTDLVAFDRDKLSWFNGYYIRSMSAELLLEKIASWATSTEIELAWKDAPQEEKVKVVSIIKERLKVLSEVPQLIEYFFTEPKQNTGLLLKFAKTNERKTEILNAFISTYENIEDWQAEAIEIASKSLIGEQEFKPKEAFMTVRVAVSGVSATPPIFDTLEVIGKEAVLKRLRAALN